MKRPPFTLAALETSIGKRLGIPAYDIRSIAAQIFDRYESGGPAGATWRSQRAADLESSQVGYDLCRGEWSGGIYSSTDEAMVQSLAGALNELEGRDSDATGTH
jgi:hypothetical protein